MAIIEPELTLPKRRRRLFRLRRWLNRLLGVLWVCGLLWVFWASPLLANPFEVLNRIEAGTLDDKSLVLMAAMLPVVVLITAVLLVALETKYQAIIHELREDE